MLTTAAVRPRTAVKTYKAINATPGTGIAEAIKTSWAATAGTLLLRNGSTSLFYRPKYIRLINTVVPASAVRSEGLITVDNKAGGRYSSGSTDLTPKGADMNNGVASGATVRFGALVLGAASSSVRALSRFQLRGAIVVQYEEFVIAFDRDRHDFNTLGGTAVQRHVVDVGPVLFGPSQELMLHLWHPSNAATPPSWEVEVCWEESRKGDKYL